MFAHTHTHEWGGVVAQFLGALAVLPEDPNLVPVTPIKLLTTVYNSSSRGANTLFWPMQALHSCGICAHVHTHIHINFKILL